MSDDFGFLIRMVGTPFLLRFFFDPGSGICLWAGNDAAREQFGYAVAASSLPIPDNLHREIEGACSDFNTSIDWANPAGPSPWSPTERAAFDARADQLLSHVRLALGPPFEVRDERDFRAGG